MSFEAQERPTPAFSVHLDAIRGFAALIVFLGHARSFFFSSVFSQPSANLISAAKGAAPPASTLGHQAVIVFFVLSGYLVGGALLRDLNQGAWSWRRYALHRLSRLWTVLIPALVLGLLLDCYGASHFAGRATVYHPPPGTLPLLFVGHPHLSLGTFLGNAFFLQGIRVPLFGSNLALWSLSYEFWYYVLFPLGALLFTGRFRVGQRAACGLVFLALSLFLGQRIMSYFLVWIAGALVTVLAPYIPARWQNAASIFAALQLALVAALSRVSLIGFEWADLLLAISCSVLLYCVTHHSAPLGPGFYRRAAQATARMSYTLYLTHVPALALLCAFLLHPWRQWPKDPVHLGLFAGVLALVWLYAIAAYWCFERHTTRLREWLERKAGSTPPQRNIPPRHAWTGAKTLAAERSAGRIS